MQIGGQVPQSGPDDNPQLQTKFDGSAVDETTMKLAQN